MNERGLRLYDRGKRKAEGITPAITDSELVSRTQSVSDEQSDEDLEIQGPTVANAAVDSAEPDDFGEMEELNRIAQECQDKGPASYVYNLLKYLSETVFPKRAPLVATPEVPSSHAGNTRVYHNDRWVQKPRIFIPSLDPKAKVAADHQSRFIEFDPTVAFFCISENQSKRIIIHQRDIFLSQRQFMSKYGECLFVAGPPGTGKSLCVYVHVHSKNFECARIVWIGNGASFVLEGKTMFFYDGALDPTPFIESLPKDDTSEIIVLDGYTKDPHYGLNIPFNRVQSHPSKRVLIVTSSFSATPKIPANVIPFIIPSWILKELQIAFRNRALKELVSKNFFDENNKRMSLEDKFRLVGGSTRNMFSRTVPECKASISHHVSRVVDVWSTPGSDSTILAINSILGRELRVLPHLFTGLDSDTRVTIVSEFATHKIAQRNNEPESLEKLYLWINNPCYRGCLFEEWCIAMIRKKGLKYHRDGREEIWPVSEVAIFSSSAPAQYDGSIWLRPDIFNEPTYDIAFYDRGVSLLRFVQITQNKVHDFKIGHLATVVKNFQKAGNPVNRIELLALVPLKIQAVFRANIINQYALRRLHKDFPIVKNETIDRLGVKFSPIDGNSV